jgi:hypothetical protein
MRELELHPNEASDLLPVEDHGILEARGWDVAFWTVLDEGAIEDSMAVIGHRRGSAQTDESWEVVRPRFRAVTNAGRTEDAEACAHRDGWVYAVRALPVSRSATTSPRALEAVLSHSARSP